MTSRRIFLSSAIVAFAFWSHTAPSQQVTPSGGATTGGGAVVSFAANSPWPTQIAFDSADHVIACPADSCVSGYIVELWKAADIGVSGRKAIGTWNVGKNEVVSTNSTPAYATETWRFYPSLSSLVINTDYVYVMQAYGEFMYVRSPRSAPSNIAFRIALDAATEVYMTGYTVTFAPPAQHGSTYPVTGGSSNIIARYDVKLYRGTTLVKTVNIGRPNPMDGLIARDLTTDVRGLASVPHTARVVAVSSAGSMTSVASNAFTPPVITPTRPSVPSIRH